jgi:hypothetical protein
MNGTQPKYDSPLLALSLSYRFLVLFSRYPCTIVEAMSSPTTITCDTVANMVASDSHLNVSVEVMDVRVIGSDRLVPLVFPEILAMKVCYVFCYSFFLSISVLQSSQGCTDVFPNTVKCPTAGGIEITLIGSGFHSPLDIRINGLVCVTVFPGPADIGIFTEARCTLSPGVGSVTST